MHLRDRNGAKKLFLSASANSPRVHLTTRAPENPAVPPMFCMLMRKHLTSAQITDVRQNGLDRVLAIDFSATNELGDRVALTLYAEIMAKHSNLILVSESGRIVDAVKRIDCTQSSVRQVLPGGEYHNPPTQNKLSLLDETAKKTAETVFSFSSKLLSSSLLSCVEGASPLICREIAETSGGDIQTGCADKAQRERVCAALESIKERLVSDSGEPTMLKDETGKPFDFSFEDIRQYGTAYAFENMRAFRSFLTSFTASATG